MRIKRFSILFVIVWGLLWSNFLLSQSQEEEIPDRDYYGKVVIQVIDANTSEPVNEIFRVNFFDPIKVSKLREDPFDTSSLVWYGKTNTKGRLIANLKPGTYYLQFIPESSESKYEYEPSPLLSERNRQTVFVEDQKITEVFKKMHYGGKLKIVLVDPDGNKINPRVSFSPDVQISLDINSEYFDFGIFNFVTLTTFDLTKGKDDLNDGEMVIGRLYPGKYHISIDFDSSGFKYKEMDNIEVFRNQTTTAEVIVDIFDKTGIEGYITDQNGTPLKDFFVRIDNAVAKTNQNGFYRIIGIDEGIHDIDIANELDTTRVITNFSEVYIVEGMMIRKDFVLEIN
jgi:hypothetical protein